MTTLPTEKVQDMITKLQEYHASVLVKIEEKTGELEALLRQKLEQARLSERRSCALLLRSLVTQHTGTHTPLSSPPPPQPKRVTALRITTPPPPEPEDLSSSTLQNADKSDTSIDASHVVTGRPPRFMTPSQTAMSKPGTCGVSASLMDTVVVSPLSSGELSVNQSNTSWPPAILEFLKLAESNDFPCWAFAGGGSHRHADEQATANASRSKRVRFCSKSPQVAVYSVERSPIASATPTAGADPMRSPHGATPLAFHTSTSSDSSLSTLSRSSEEIRSAFYTKMAAVQSEITTTRSRIDRRGTPSHGCPTLTGAATPTSPVAVSESSQEGWLDPLDAPDTEAAHTDDVSSHAHSLSFRGSPILRVANTQRRRLAQRSPANTYGVGGPSMSVNLSALPAVPPCENSRTNETQYKDDDDEAVFMSLPHKRRAVEKQQHTLTVASSKKKADTQRSQVASRACGGPSVRYRQTPVVTQMRGACANISLACGPTLYFSD